MPDDELKVTDIRVVDVPEFSRTGAFSMVREVTFFVGPHGPFARRYNIEDYTAEKVQQDIDSEVQGLRILMGKFSP